MTARATNTAPAMLSVYSGRVCIGWIIARGRAGFEAFDADQRSLGVRPTQKEAAAAVSAAASIGGAS